MAPTGFRGKKLNSFEVCDIDVKMLWASITEIPPLCLSNSSIDVNILVMLGHKFHEVLRKFKFFLTKLIDN